MKKIQKKPIVHTGDWVVIGAKHAVVCSVYKDTKFGDIEVVYLDDMERAINEDVFWNEDEWKFRHDGPCGGYADKYDRLRNYVAILRRGY